MPRPKRTKVAPSGPAAPARRGRPPAPARETREVSDDIESSQEQNNAPKAQPVAKRVTRGSATVSDPLKNAAPLPKLSAAHNRVLEESKSRRDSAMARLDAENQATSDTEGLGNATSQIPGAGMSSSPEVEVGRRGRVVSSVESSAVIPAVFRRRARQPSILGRGGEVERSASVESDMAQSQDITNIERPVGEVMMSGFKRRQRQPSILGRAGNARSSSVEVERDVGTPANPGSALATGMFRRRARQASILGTPSHNPNGNLQAAESDMDGEDDFNPEDESTPLNLPKTKSLEDILQSTPPSSANPRKRKLSPLPLPQSSSPPPLVERSPTSSLSLPSISPPPQMRPQTPEPASSTNAPPHSSSSLAITPSPPRHIRATTAQPPTRTPARRRQPSRAATFADDDDSLPSSPPSLTHSPDNRPVAKKPAGKPKGRAAAKPKPPTTLTTAELQSLLPQRRRRTRAPRDVYDIGSSGAEELGSDEDELSHLTTATARTNRRTPAPGPRRAVTKLKSGKGRAAATAAAKRTYGSRAAAAAAPLSDKENGEGEGSDAGEGSGAELLDPDDSLAPLREGEEESSELEARVGRELKEAKRKFEDVDRWEMEFEEVAASSSSQKDAR